MPALMSVESAEGRPDEDSEEQVRGTCDVVWECGVDGVVVGNITKRRYDLVSADYNLISQGSGGAVRAGGIL